MTGMCVCIAQAFKLAELRGSEEGGGGSRKLVLSAEQQQALGLVFAPAVFDGAGRAAVVVGEAPAGAGALDNSAKLDRQLDAILVDPRYELMGDE